MYTWITCNFLIYWLSVTCWSTVKFACKAKKQMLFSHYLNLHTTHTCILFFIYTHSFSLYVLHTHTHVHTHINVHAQTFVHPQSLTHTCACFCLSERITQVLTLCCHNSYRPICHLAVCQLFLLVCLTNANLLTLTVRCVLVCWPLENSLSVTYSNNQECACALVSVCMCVCASVSMYVCVHHCVCVWVWEREIHVP